MKTKIIRKGYVAKEGNTRQLPVSQLEIGMFVSELDRPWVETPFLMQGFLIETQEHIDLVQELCEYVYIDSLQEVYIPPEERATSATKRAPRYIHKVPVEQEHAAASGVFKHARDVTKSVLDEVRLGNALDADKAKNTVSKCVDSILRNPDALMWLSKIRNVNSHIADHCLNTSVLAIAFGRYLEFDIVELHQLGLCALLHDIGKMKIPPEILSKGTELNEQEKEILKSHTINGRNILMSHPTLYSGTTDVAHCHHEHLDGTGYPRGIKGVGISMNTRIVSIVDTYDNFTTNQPGSPAKTSLDAMRELYAKRGSHFDNDLVLKFIKCVGLYPPGSIVELQNAEVGIVISTNYKNRRLPKIMIHLDAKKKHKKPQVINLGDPKQQGEKKEYLIKDVLIDGSYGIFIKNHIEKGLVFS